MFARGAPPYRGVASGGRLRRSNVPGEGPTGPPSKETRTPHARLHLPGSGLPAAGHGPAVGRHPSWELVEEASEVAERDVARLLLDADADELKDTRNAQLTTFVSSLMVLDAVERLGIEPGFCAGHSLGEYTALTATRRPRLRRRRAAGHRAGRRHARRRPWTSPGTMAAVLGLDDDLVEVACRRADSRRVGGQLQRPRPGRDRRLGRGRRRRGQCTPRSSAPRR